MKFSAIIAVVALPILAVATPAPAPIEAVSAALNDLSVNGH